MSTRPPSRSICARSAANSGSKLALGYPSISLRASRPSDRRRSVNLECSHAIVTSSARSPNFPRSSGPHTTDQASSPISREIHARAVSPS